MNFYRQWERQYRTLTGTKIHEVPAWRITSTMTEKQREHALVWLLASASRADVEAAFAYVAEKFPEVSA